MVNYYDLSVATASFRHNNEYGYEIERVKSKTPLLP